MGGVGPAEKSHTRLLKLRHNVENNKVLSTPAPRDASRPPPRTVARPWFFFAFFNR